MPSLKEKFDELYLRLDQGRRLESTGSDPIYYLVFPCSDILEVKRHTRAWVAKLENQGWRVTVLSMGETMNSIFRKHRLRKLWVESEKNLLSHAEQSDIPIDYGDINKTLSKALTESTDMIDQVRSRLQEASSHKKGLLLLTDLEALHPYMRINSIEAQIQGTIHCPVVVLYPGKREGKTSLRFLEFYPADPNYRSEHIG